MCGQCFEEVGKQNHRAAQHVHGRCAPKPTEDIRLPRDRPAGVPGGTAPPRQGPDAPGGRLLTQAKKAAACAQDGRSRPDTRCAWLSLETITRRGRGRSLQATWCGFRLHGTCRTGKVTEAVSGFVAAQQVGAGTGSLTEGSLLLG